MDTATLLVVLAISGVNFGWQPADDGATGYEYTVQVEPELIDALERGESVPIESNIPPEVNPIRKVRIVVGRGDLPRSAVRHTVNFADQAAGWAPDRYPPTNTGSAAAGRYPASNPSGVAPPPALVDQAQSAANQFSRAGSQVVDDTRNAAEGFGRQLQQWGNDANQQLQSAGNSLPGATVQTLDATANQFRQAADSLGLTGNSAVANNGSSVSAPPWPSSTSSTAQSGQSGWPIDGATPRVAAVNETVAAPRLPMTPTSTGWTSIGTSVAAPPLLNPPMPTAFGNNAGLRVAAAPTAGPTFPVSPAEASGSRGPLHSPLVDPMQQSAAANGLGNNWNTNGQAVPASIGRNADPSSGGFQAGGDLVPVRPVTPGTPTAQDTQQAASRWGNLWDETNSWQQQSQNNSPQGSQPPPNGTFANAGQNPAQPPAQPIIGQSGANANSANYATNPNLPAGNPLGIQVAGGHQSPAGPPAEQPPWIPLIVTMLSLVGSLSANLFLGWSYLDARYKYSSLAHKTANTFRRVTRSVAA